MKRFIQLVFFIVILLNKPKECFSQEVVGCINCKPSCLCKAVVGDKYNADKIGIIKQNWTDFEGQDLEASFPAKGIPNIISLRFDGLGCVYPSFMVRTSFKDKFLDDGVKIKSLSAHTFYTMLWNDSHVFDTYDSNNKDLFAELYDMIKQSSIKGKVEVNSGYFKFKDKWNEVFLTEQLEQAKTIIVKNKIEQCVFFIAGYNVPFSLAHIQGSAVFEDIKAVLPIETKVEKILFIRVFWPSHNAKFKIFGRSFCNMDNKKNLTVAKLYKYVTNRAYLISLSLRKYISQLDNHLSFNIISHSFGAVIATGIVLHPLNKIDHNERESNFNKPLIEAFNTTCIPKQKIAFFLSAPGIPGVTTFLPLTKEANANNYFYVGYNIKDKVLLKNIFPTAWLTKPPKHNSTTLGCNWLGEIDSVKAIVHEKHLEQNFTYCDNGNRSNHDYFCYRLQDSFKANFSSYVRTHFTIQK